jgi:hypothetical protein
LYRTGREQTAVLVHTVGTGTASTRKPQYFCVFQNIPADFAHVDLLIRCGSDFGFGCGCCCCHLKRET